jgi:hypothetical protein
MFLVLSNGYSLPAKIFSSNIYVSAYIPEQNRSDNLLQSAGSGRFCYAVRCEQPDIPVRLPYGGPTPDVLAN